MKSVATPHLMQDPHYHLNRNIEYAHKQARPDPTHRYLWPVIRQVILEGYFETFRAFDLGCGNGATSDMIRKLGFEVIGVDASDNGIALAKSASR